MGRYYVENCFDTFSFIHLTSSTTFLSFPLPSLIRFFFSFVSFFHFHLHFLLFLSSFYFIYFSLFFLLQTLSKIFKSGYSRIPVYGRNTNDIVGLILTKDLIFLDPEVCVGVSVCERKCECVDVCMSVRVCVCVCV